jgi:hypothetical protein
MNLSALKWMQEDFIEDIMSDYGYNIDYSRYSGSVYFSIQLGGKWINYRVSDHFNDNDYSKINMTQFVNENIYKAWLSFLLFVGRTHENFMLCLHFKCCVTNK